MNVNIYDENLNRIAPIEERFVSCLWSEGYNTTESFTLELQATEELKKKVKVGCYVGRDDRPTMMVVKSVEYKDGKIIASGKQATRLLEDVAMMGTIDTSSSFEAQIIKQYGELQKDLPIGPYEIKSSVETDWGNGITATSQNNKLNGVSKSTALSDSIKQGRKLKFTLVFTPTNADDFKAGVQFQLDSKFFPASIYADGVEIKPNVEALEKLGVGALFFYIGTQAQDFAFGAFAKIGKVKVEDNQIVISNLDSAKPFLADHISEIEVETDYFNPKDIWDIPSGTQTIAMDVGFFPDKGSRCTIKPVRDKKGTAVEMLDFKSNGITRKSNFMISNTNFGEVCSKECQSLDYGLKVTKQENRLVAEFYKPAENTENIFSEAFGNLKLDSLLNSKENYKNYAIVLGGMVNNYRLRVDVDLSRGERVNQMVVDARDLQFDEGDPWRLIYQELENRGQQKLLEQKAIENVSFELSDKDFGTKYDLGDIITARINSFDMVVKARIVRFTQKSQNNTTETVVEVGNLVFTQRRDK